MQPIVGRILDPTQVDDGEIVTASLKDHLPRTVVHAHSPSRQEVTLWVAGTSGIKEKRWSLSSKKWNNGFIGRGNSTAQRRTGVLEAFDSRDIIAPAAWNPRLAMVSSFDGAANNAHVRGAFAFNTRSGFGMIGGPSLSGNPLLASTATYSWLRHNAQTGGFIPRTGFSRREGPIEKVSIFGTDTAGQNLTELHFDGSSWRQSIHGKPNAFSGRMHIGTQSSVWDPISNQGYVYVEVKRNDGADAFSSVWCRYWDGSTWKWIDVGHPFHGEINGYSSEGLVAVGYRTGSTFTVKVILNAVTAEFGGRDALFVMTTINVPRLDPTGRVLRMQGSVGEWLQWVVPNGHRYTSGVTWERAGSRQVHIFGHSADGKLLNFHMNESSWAFGDTPRAPDGQAFRTDASYLVDGPNYKRIAVVGRTASGRIYERYQTIENRTESAWDWADLSTLRGPA